MADLFTPEITPEIRAAVIAELRAKAAELAPQGRGAIPGGMCGTITSMRNGKIYGPHPSTLYGEDKTLEYVANGFKRMLDAAEGIELYQPCNGEEGRDFMGRWCERCTKFDAGCEIVGDTLFLDVDDDDYPREWRQDGEAGPRCTAFEVRDA